MALETLTIEITDENIEKYFNKTGGTYTFEYDSSNSRWRSTNYNINSSTATLTLTAKQDCTINLKYQVSSETNYDKYSITVNGTTKVNAISGAGSVLQMTETSLSLGQTITFTYIKDSSTYSNDDRAYFSEFKITGTFETGPVIDTNKKIFYKSGIMEQVPIYKEELIDLPEEMTTMTNLHSISATNKEYEITTKNSSYGNLTIPSFLSYDSTLKCWCCTTSGSISSYASNTISFSLLNNTYSNNWRFKITVVNFDKIRTSRYPFKSIGNCQYNNYRFSSELEVEAYNTNYTSTSLSTSVQMNTIGRYDQNSIFLKIYFVKTPISSFENEEITGIDVNQGNLLNYFEYGYNYLSLPYKYSGRAWRDGDYLNNTSSIPTNKSHYLPLILISRGDYTLNISTSIENRDGNGETYSEKFYLNDEKYITSVTPWNTSGDSWTDSESWNLSISKGDKLVFCLNNPDEDNFYYFKIIITRGQLYQKTNEIIGYEVQEKMPQIKKIYYGVSNLGKKIKKVYFGVNGYAKKIFGNSNTLEYYGLASPLSAANYSMVSTNFNKNTVFLGGGSPYKTTKYDTNLVKTNLTDLTDPVYYPDSNHATNENYIIIPVSDNTTGSQRIMTINKDFVQSKITLQRGYFSNAGLDAINDNFIVVGGSYKYSNDTYGYTNKVNKIDSNLTLSDLTGLSRNGASYGSTSFKNHALFIGGSSDSRHPTYQVRGEVFAYDNNFTKTDLNSIDMTEYGYQIGTISATSGSGIPSGVVENLSIFLLGIDSSDNVSHKMGIAAYDNNLTKIQYNGSMYPTVFGGYYYTVGASSPGYVIFHSYWYGSIQYTNNRTVPIGFDENLTLKIFPNWPISTCWKSGIAAVDDYILIAGGTSSSIPSSTNSPKTQVYVYKTLA